MDRIEDLEYTEQELNDYSAIAESTEFNLLKRRYKESLNELKFQEFVTTLKIKKKMMIQGLTYGAMGGSVVGFTMSLPFAFKSRWDLIFYIFKIF